MQQSSIQKSVNLSGIGLHSGVNVSLTFHPADANSGIRFRRVDLEGRPELLVDVSKVVSTNRGTTIKMGSAQVSTVEHILSALAGMRIDNILIDIDGPEVPIMEGSAKPFVDALVEAGLSELPAEREYILIEEPIAYRDEVSGTEIMALPHDDFEVTTMIDFNSHVLGKQYAELRTLDHYIKDISSARTFVFLRELEHLHDQNLIKGGNLDNALVIADRVMSEEELATLALKLGKQTITVEKEGVLNTADLRYKNEPARHKLLDLLGDLYLLGKPIKGKIVATKPGHSANVEFAKLLKVLYRKQKKLRGKPKYNPNTVPIFNINQIKRMLPHRYPFLLVDKIIELSKTHVVGIKNITFNEGLFQGHFPGNPVFPAVLQVEALAQTGGILALSQVEDPQNWDTYFIKIDNTRFKHKVLPGDTLLLKMELLSPIRRGIVHMLGTAYVGDNIVSEGELTAQIVNRLK